MNPGVTMNSMDIDRELFDRLAALLEYPDHDWSDRIDECERSVATCGDNVASPFLAFREATALTIDQLQEGYVRTFELSTECTLEAGFHLFGETYKRGEFLAHLREEEEPYDIGQEHQLPDYLPVLLRLVGRVEDDELRRDLIGACVLPAVEKMQVTLASKGGPYGALMTSVAGALEARLRLEIELAPEGSPEMATYDDDSIPGAIGGAALEPQIQTTCGGAVSSACSLENGHA